MTIIFVSSFLNFSQFVSIVLDYVDLGLNLSQFFSIFLDFSRLCRNMHGIHFYSIGSRVSLSQFFSIFLEICMEYNFVELGAGSVCLNFSQLSSWNYVISSVPKAAMARTGSAI